MTKAELLKQLADANPFDTPDLLNIKAEEIGYDKPKPKEKPKPKAAPKTEKASKADKDAE